MHTIDSMQGQCLCGAVCITTPRNLQVEACHCGMCRRWGGGPLIGINCGTDAQLTGEDQVGVFSSSDWAERGFCKVCGTHLFYRLKDYGVMFIPAGLFQSQIDFELTEQVFIDSKPDYYEFANQTHTMTGAEVFAKFTQD